MIKKIKIVTCIALITLIAGAIGYFFAGHKMDQQRKLFLRAKLMKLESKLGDMGVRLCLIRTDSSSQIIPKGHMIVLLDFSEKDYQVIKKNLEKIENVINEYIWTENPDKKILAIKYLDSDGLNLEDTLKGRLDLNVDETDVEYYSVIREYNNKLEEDLWVAFDVADINRSNLRFKIISDVTYDVTLQTNIVKKQYLYARFKDLGKKRIQGARFIYKKIGDFNQARGDKIYFYNLPKEEFILINKMVSFTRKHSAGDKIIYLDEFISN